MHDFPWDTPTYSIYLYLSTRSFLYGSRSRSPARRGRSEDRYDRSRSPSYRKSPLPSKGGRKRSLTPDVDSPRGRRSPSPRNGRMEMEKEGSDYSPRVRSRSPVSPRLKSRSPVSPDRDSPVVRKYPSPSEADGRGRSPSPDRSPVADYDDDNRRTPRGSESP